MLDTEETLGARVLCVDDESMIGELVTRILRNQLRCEVTVARSGAEALGLLEHSDFEILLVDYVMPKMDGGQLHEEIRRRRPELLARLLFITGDILSESTLGTIERTGCPLLMKPFGLPELRGAILGMLARTPGRGGGPGDAG